LWQIFTQVQPYSLPPHDTKDPRQIADFVRDGGRLDIPKDIPPRIQALIKACWEQDGRDRPIFGRSIVPILEQLLESTPRTSNSNNNIPNVYGQILNGLGSSTNNDMLGERFGQSFSSESGYGVARKSISPSASQNAKEVYGFMPKDENSSSANILPRCHLIKQKMLQQPTLVLTHQLTNQVVPFQSRQET